MPFLSTILPFSGAAIAALAILKGFGKVHCADVLTASQIGDGARQFEHAMVGTGGQLKLVHGGFHEVAARIIQLAELAHLGWTHFGVEADGGTGETLRLDIPGGFHTSAHSGGGFAGAVVGELLVLHAGYLDVDVDAVHQGTGDTLLVTGDRYGGAGAGLESVAIVTTRARIHGSDELEIGRESEGTGGTADGDHLIFQGLAKNLEDAHAKLGKLIEEEDTAVSKGDFTRVRLVAATDQTGMRNGMVRGAEGTGADQRGTSGKLIGDGVDLGNVEGFIDAHAGEDGGHSSGEEGFARAGRTGHEDVMEASSGNLEGALDVFLSFDIAEVGLDDGIEALHTAARVGLDVGVDASEVAVEGGEGRYRDDLEVGDESGFGGVGFGDEDGVEALLACQGCHGEDAANMADGAIERKLADDQAVFQTREGYLVGGGEYAKGDGKVVGGSFLANRSGGKVDGDSLAGIFQPGVLDCGLNTFAAFLNGGIGETDDDHRRQARGSIYFYLDDDSL